MKIEKLQYFIDLYENRSYTKTAQKNYISQTSVTQFINSLEAEFNVCLFDRSILPIQPTDAGTLLYNEAKVLLQQYRHMEDVTAAYNAGMSMTVRICYTSDFDLQLLLPFMVQFKKKYPKIPLEFCCTTFKEITTCLAACKCDATIATYCNTENKSSDTIKNITLYRGKFEALVGKNHDLYKRDCITKDELYHYPLVIMSKDIIGDNYERILHNTKLDGYYPNIQKTVGDAQTQLLSIITDDYIGFAPDNYSFEQYEGYLRKIPITGSSHFFCLDLQYAADKNPSMEILSKELERYLKKQ